MSMFVNEDKTVSEVLAKSFLIPLGDVLLGLRDATPATPSGAIVLGPRVCCDLDPGVLVYFIPKSMVMSNDYVWTLGIFHWVVSMLMTLSFPVNWIWWVTTIAVHLPVGFAADKRSDIFET